jgi:hypothetical protein
VWPWSDLACSRDVITQPSEALLHAIQPQVIQVDHRATHADADGVHACPFKGARGSAERYTYRWDQGVEPEPRGLWIAMRIAQLPGES